MKELGERKAGVPRRWSLAFLSQAEEQVTSKRKKPNSLGKSREDSEPSAALACAPGRGQSSHLQGGSWDGRAHSVCSLQAWVGGAAGNPV